jgi:HK97 family phage prohead protease
MQINGAVFQTKSAQAADLDEKLYDEYLDVSFEIKEVAEDGTFTGYASTFGNVDSDRDVIAQGAFTKSLKRKKPKQVKLLWQHDRRQPIGVWEEITEDNRGLKVKGRLVLDVNQAREAYALMKAGAIDAMSIGFAIPRDGYEIDEKKRVRVIKEADLWEISVVTFPANPKATISRVKSVVPFQDLPIADRGRAWDGAAAEARVRQWAGGGSSLEDMDWEKYRHAFLWYDAENPEQVTSYKLGVADVINGELTVVPRAIFASAGAVLGARGGVDVPSGERPRIISHLERYYSKLDMESPFKALDMGETVKSYVQALLATCDTEREFERTLREVGFSKKDATAFASIREPQWDAGDEEAEAKLNEALDLLKTINCTSN